MLRRGHHQKKLLKLPHLVARDLRLMRGLLLRNGDIVFKGRRRVPHQKVSVTAYHPTPSSSVGSSEARHSASSSDETAHVCMYMRLIKAMISMVDSSIISLKDESTTIPNVFLVVIASL